MNTPHQYPLRLTQVPSEPHAQKWIEEMQPLLAAWLNRGLGGMRRECQFSACMAAVLLMPYLAEDQRKRIRSKAQEVARTLAACTPPTDPESRISILLLLARLG